MEGKLKITASSFDNEISISISEDSNVHEVMDRFEILLLGLEYHPNAIKRAIIEKAKELEEE